MKRKKREGGKRVYEVPFMQIKESKRKKIGSINTFIRTTSNERIPLWKFDQKEREKEHTRNIVFLPSNKSFISFYKV